MGTDSVFGTSVLWLQFSTLAAWLTYLRSFQLKMVQQFGSFIQLSTRVEKVTDLEAK